MKAVKNSGVFAS